LRCEHPDVIKAACHFSGTPLDDAVKVFAAIREWRNRF
jgi:hydroxyacylglutathione hydrolase